MGLVHPGHWPLGQRGARGRRDPGGSALRVCCFGSPRRRFGVWFMEGTILCRPQGPAVRTELKETGCFGVQGGCPSGRGFPSGRSLSPSKPALGCQSLAPDWKVRPALSLQGGRGHGSRCGDRDSGREGGHALGDPTTPGVRPWLCVASVLPGGVTVVWSLWPVDFSVGFPLKSKEKPVVESVQGLQSMGPRRPVGGKACAASALRPRAHPSACLPAPAARAGAGGRFSFPSA